MTMQQQQPPNQQLSEAEREKMLRDALWVPCESKEDLLRWIRVYLGVDFPDGHVDLESNSSPAEILWEVYSKALKNDDPEFSRVMTYAARGSFKTLISATIEVLCLTHLDRDVVHVAAILEQSEKAQTYVKAYFSRPILRDFVDGNNKTQLVITRYVHARTHKSLTTKEWKALSADAAAEYQRVSNYVDITPCTMAGTNSKHSAFMVVDEVDVITGEKVKAYEQAKAIPMVERGKYPITLLISTRKTSVGKVQAEIDDAPQTGLVLRHWNVLDVTQPCPTSRHQPDMPMVTLYRDPKTLKVLTPTQLAELPEEKRSGYERRQAFWGCEHNCKLFGPCEGHLATRAPQRRSPMLRDIPFVTTQFSSFSPEMVEAELLCRKPSKHGIIYANLDPDVHLLTATQMAAALTGDDNYPPDFGKANLLALMRSRDMRAVGGIDFGFSHNFSVVLGFTEGNRLFVVSAASQPELLPAQQLALAQQLFVFPDGVSARVYCDPENPQMVKVLKQGGVHCADWKKTQGSVLAGIEAIRLALSPSVGAPRLFFLRGDDGVEFVFSRLSKYHWKLDAAGRPTSEPDEENDDECDSTRYMVMNVLGRYGRVIVAPDPGVDADVYFPGGGGAYAGMLGTNPYRQPARMPGDPPSAQKPMYTPEQKRVLDWAAIAGAAGIPESFVQQPQQQAEKKKDQSGIASTGPRNGRKGSFSWDL